MNFDHQHIIAACLQGDRGAQKKLFELFNSLLYKSACLYINDNEQAKGLVQETWIDIFKGLGTYDQSKSQLLTWMKTILIRKVWRANEEKKLTTELDHSHKVFNHQAQILDRLSCEEILNEMNAIPAASRIVFKLYVLEEYKHKEIAEILSISAATSRVHLTKARNILRNRQVILDKIILK